jgi:Xaa-Pro dipeptidase
MINSITNLLEAERKAAILFNEAEIRNLISSGKTEKVLNKEIYELAYELFGIKKYWHKRIVRAGRNTLYPYRVNPKNLEIQEDDILFFDFGPIFDNWEADFGRTFVIGDNVLKKKLKNDVANVWKNCRDWYFEQNDITGAELFHQAVKISNDFGWKFGDLIGQFPHEKLEKENKENYVHPKNNKLMSLPDNEGKKREWILEIHLVEKSKEIGAFYEQLLI